MRIPIWRSEAEVDARSDLASNTSDAMTNLNQTTGSSDTLPPYTPEDNNATPSPRAQVSLSLHPIASKQALIVKAQPARAPARPLDHVPCDIVLVIDVSGSMSTDAPLPGQKNPNERTGLSVLDLVRHAALTLVETLGEEDRLGIVTFATSAEVLQPLRPMTPDRKDRTRARIRAMDTRSATNLWGGIQAGLELFDTTTAGSKVPALMVLTDGMPNHMCPSRGYVPKLRSMMPLPATIHTFGFGYHLRSGLLKSIAEIGGGNYAFIPDAGMIGTVFVHAAANLQATFATNAVLQLTYHAPMTLKQAMGDSVEHEQPVNIQGHPDGVTRLVVPLGNLQYGQSRDMCFHVRELNGKDGDELNSVKEHRITAALAYQEIIPGSVPSTGLFGSQYLTNAIDAHGNPAASCSLEDEPNLSEAEIAYHDSRARICNFVSAMFPIGEDGEHRSSMAGQEAKAQLDWLVRRLPARKFPTDPQNKSLVEDLTGDDPYGQVSLAVGDASYFQRWGQHYLPSYLNAHTRQICNSFKDPGPQQYGSDSPLFIQCRNRLDSAFDSLPPPSPTAPVSRAPGVSYTNTKSMAMYNSNAEPCFAGSTVVRLSSGRSTVAVRKLRRGTEVWTPAGARRVALVLKTPVQDTVLCRVGGLLLTPWHPVSQDDGKTWVFPASLPTAGALRYTGAVYSVLLERDSDTKAHAIAVGGMLGVTLGHGVTSGDSDVRAHEFLGDYERVGKSLLSLGKVRKSGVVVGGGVVRNETTGRVCGLKPAVKGQ